MRTLGIDLASQPDNTALCLIEWADGRASVIELAKGADRSGDKLTDGRLLGAITGEPNVPAPTMTAIDAPFGWPKLFAEVIADPDRWPDSLDENPRELLRRATDLAVEGVTGKQPLAVTTERIAYAAIRANRMLSRLQRGTNFVVDRSGATGVICETYPDAALREFGLWPKGLASSASYKGETTTAVRGRIVEGLRLRAPWLTLADAHLEALHRSDDCVDALVCALVARARERGHTTQPPDPVLASVEGWIHLPESAGVLELLVD